MLAVAAVVAIPLCLSALLFAEQVMHWKWFSWHSWFVFFGGYLIDHNPHQPNAIGMAVAEYLFWFSTVLIFMGIHAAARLVANKSAASEDEAKTTPSAN